MRTIYVEGSIIFKEGLSWVKNIGSNCHPDWRERADKVIVGDLNVTKDNRTKSYVEYLAGGEVVSFGGNEGDCRFLTSPDIIIKEYRENNELVKEFADVPLSERFEKIRFNQLFISVIANLELFLSEVMVNLVLGNEEYYNNFLEKYNEKISCREVLKFKDEPEQFVYDLIKKINCHRLDVIQSFFKKIFNVKVCAPDGLNAKINLRHDLVHRFGRKAEGGANLITEKDLNELIVLSDGFVDEIEKEFSQSIFNWSGISKEWSK